MVDALCNLENIPKHCLKQIGTERSHNYGCRSLNEQVLLDLTFSHRGLSVYPSFVKLSGEIIYELEQKLSVQLKSRC